MKTRCGQNVGRTGFFKYMLSAFLILQLSACEKDGERTTGVYGTVTDPDGKPVAGVKVMVYGSDHCGPLSYFGVDSTNQAGDYNITFEASKRFDSFNTAIPLSETENPKIFTHFSDITVKKNDEAVGICCITQPGNKTKYDFKLVAK